MHTQNNASSGSTGSELDTATNKDIAKLGLVSSGSACSRAQHVYDIPA